MNAGEIRKVLRGIPDGQEVAIATWERSGRHYYRFHRAHLNPITQNWQIKEKEGKTILVLGTYDRCAAAEIIAEQKKK